MGSYGRNGHFLQPPDPKHRLGRGKTGELEIVMFAPVALGTVEDPLDGRREIGLAAVAAPPLVGKHGIIISERPWTNLQDRDRAVTRPSDIDTVPPRTQAQVCHGTEVRVQLRNTEDVLFEGQRNYPGRKMILDDLEDVDIDDLLTPGPGDATGFWKLTSTASQGWLRVTGVHPEQGLVEAQLLF